MTQEEKQLLLIDLSGRVRYGVRLWLKLFEGKEKHFIGTHNILGSVKYDRGSEYKISLIDKGEYNIEGHRFSNYEQVIKPYLRSLSSMTEEERLELSRLTDDKFKFYLYTAKPEIVCYEKYNYLEGLKVLDWLNAYHFDYRGLIPMGLAIEAPEGMYNN